MPLLRLLVLFVQIVDSVLQKLARRLVHRLLLLDERLGLGHLALQLGDPLPRHLRLLVAFSLEIRLQKPELDRVRLELGLNLPLQRLYGGRGLLFGSLHLRLLLLERLLLPLALPLALVLASLLRDGGFLRRLRRVHLGVEGVERGPSPVALHVFDDAAHDRHAPCDGLLRPQDARVDVGGALEVRAQLLGDGAHLLGDS